jgi:adenylate cyclase
MRSPARILVVDDNPANVRIVQARLAADGYEVLTAMDGEAALAAVAAHAPDLVLLDVMMPKIDGIEVCRRIKGRPAPGFTPVIMVTAMADARDVVTGLDAGGDDYLTKPVDHGALRARVRSMLRIKALHDTVEAQAAEIARWNATLERRVAEQVAELERTARLKRFFSPQLAEAIVSAAGENPLASHRREITVVFLDLRGFTAFAETAEPEEVMEVLREYHGRVGPAVLRYGGTLERFAGDGLMVFFNDPVPVPDAAARAVRFALDTRARVRELADAWRRRGHDLGFGVGIAQGYATLGAIGFEGRWDYAAIGSVTNLAARLCAEAPPDHVLITQRVHAAVADLVDVAPVADLELKGFSRAVRAYNVLGLRRDVAVAG